MNKTIKLRSLFHNSFFQIMLVCFLLFGCDKLKKAEAIEPARLTIVTTNVQYKTNEFSLAQTKAKAHEALKYCKAHNMSENFCLLADMGMHSGKKRLFLWDFKNDSVVNSFLVGHGCGNNPWSSDLTKDAPIFSNIEDSHCSSLGKYKIGERAYSDWGIHIKYVLHGLESTNSNAQKRVIVLHAWDAVSDQEVYPDGTPEGWGCPTLSNNSLKIIDPLLQAENKAVLLWLYAD